MAEILLISSDLQARARLERAAGSAGLALTARSPRGGPPDASPPEVVVLDLDELGAGLPEWVRWARTEDPRRRIIGFFAHVQETTGALGRELGIEVYRRGRFWRDLPALLERGPH